MGERKKTKLRLKNELEGATAGAGDTVARGVRGRLLSDETTAYTKVIVMRQDVARRVSCVATSRDCADNGCCAHVGGHFKPEEERTESKPSDSVMGSLRRNVFQRFLILASG